MIALSTPRMRKPLVVISGLPGSGKTTVGRRLAPALHLPFIDKDDILDRLFEAKGIGDAAWRRRLSRESDEILQREATHSNGAVVASFWHLHGMPSDSGTPTSWLDSSSCRVVNVRCVCDLDVAVRRFVARKRHPGHLDGDASVADVLLRLQQLTRLPLLDVGERIDVDTSDDPNLTDLARAVRNGLERLS